MKNPFDGKKLEDLGVSSKKVLEAHQACVRAGSFDFDISGKSVPALLSAHPEGESVTVHKPTGDDARLWVSVRVNTERTSTWGFGFDVYATARGPYEGSIYTTKVGRLDDDGLFVPEKE